MKTFINNSNSKIKQTVRNQMEKIFYKFFITFGVALFFVFTSLSIVPYAYGENQHECNCCNETMIPLNKVICSACAVCPTCHECHKCNDPCSSGDGSNPNEGDDDPDEGDCEDHDNDNDTEGSLGRNSGGSSKSISSNLGDKKSLSFSNSESSYSFSGSSYGKAKARKEKRRRRRTRAERRDRSLRNGRRTREERRDRTQRKKRGGGVRPYFNPAAQIVSYLQSQPSVASLPFDYLPSTIDCGWQVSPATRNLRLQMTPLYYKPPYGPPVNFTMVYVRERTTKTSLGIQWTCNYDSYIKSSVFPGNPVNGLPAFNPAYYVGLTFVRPNGRTTTYYYDYLSQEFRAPGNNRTFSMINPSGSCATNINSSIDRVFYDTHYVYIVKADNSYEEYKRSNGRLTAMADQNGYRTTFLRDNYSNLEAIVDAAGGTTTVHSTYGTITGLTDPAGRTVQFDYLYDGWLGRVITASGTTNEFRYNKIKKTITEVMIPNRTNYFDAVYNGKTYMGLEQWNKLTVSYNNGFVCSYDWDDGTTLPSHYEIRIGPDIPGVGSMTNLIDSHCIYTITDAGGTQKTKYYISDRRVQAKDRLINGVYKPVERYYFDSRRNKTEIVVPMPNGSEIITKFAYNRNNQMTLMEKYYTGDVYKTGYECEYKTDGNLLSVTTPAGKTVYSYTNTYTLIDDDTTNYIVLLRGVRKPSGETTLFEYDDYGKIFKQTQCANTSAYIEVVCSDDGAQPYVIKSRSSGIYPTHIADLQHQDPEGQQPTNKYYKIIVAQNTQNDRVTTYYYGQNSYISSIVNPVGSTFYFNYDNIGRLISKSVSGDGGYSTSYTYDQADRLLDVYDTRAGVSAFNIFDDKGLVSTSDELGDKLFYNTDIYGRICSISNEFGLKDAYGYVTQPAAPPVWTADPWGTTDFFYANNAALIKTVNPDGSSLNNAYDSQFRLVGTTNELGGVICYSYTNSDMKVIMSNTVSEFSVSKEFDVAGRLIKTSNSAGGTADLNYENDKLSSFTASDAGTITFGYNIFGELEWAKNQHNYIVSNFYDKTGFLNEVADSLGRTVTKTRYGASSLPNTITDARGETTSFGYDDALNNTTITLPDNTVISKLHDDLGRSTSMVYGTSVILTEYDSIGRVTSASKKSASDKWIKVENEYTDAQSKPTKVRSFYENSGNSVSRETSLKYDSSGQLIYIKDPANNVVETFYNGLGLVTNVIAPNQHSASFEFDNSGRLIYEKDFHDRESTIDYDANERTTILTRPDETTVKTLTDTQGRITSIVSSGEVSRTRSFGYRADGQLTSYSGNFSGDSFSGTRNRNSAGELTISHDNYNNISGIINYTRDNGGLVVSMSPYTQNQVPQVFYGTTRTYTRDEMGKISRVQAGNVDISLYYNNNGQISTIYYPGGYYKNYSYDNAGRLLNSLYKHPYNQTPDSVTVNNQYDPYSATRLKQQQVSFNGESTRVHNYGYDVLDQITSEQTLVNGNTIGYNWFNYNGFGDKTEQTGVTIAYPDANTITKTYGSLTKTFNFDARGNLIQISETGSPTTDFEYDTDNNMVGAEVNGTNWTFRYNADNQMYYSKIVDDNSNIIDERFYVYDGLDCIAETDTDGTILREYIRVGNVGGIVAEIRHNDTTCATGYQSGTFYYHYNHRGDVIAVSKQDGTIVFKADYDAYGKISRIDSGTFSPRYTFSTKRYFKDLDLYYYGYRWYLPEIGRWTTKDPIRHLSGNLNLYKFCANNSIIYIDAYGLSECSSSGSGGPGHGNPEPKKPNNSGSYLGPYGLLTENSEGGWYHSEEVTGKIIDEAVKNLTDNYVYKDLIDTYQHASKYDFKYNSQFDTFTVNGKIIAADQFGNYLTGYATTSGFGLGGSVGSFMAGIFYGWADGITVSRSEFRTFDDNGSRKMIWQGVKDAWRERPLRSAYGNFRSSKIIYQ